MIKTLYTKHCEAHFPYIQELDLNDFDKHGVCPYSADTYIAGAISSYLHAVENNILYKIENYHYLEESRNDIEIILRTIHKDAFSYFYNLYLLSNMVLDEIQNNPAILDDSTLSTM